jgi:protein-L-isoaspartate(D-aspartate) O-methyltransferase
MTDFNFETARFNMVEQQVRPWDVLDPEVLQLLASAPRDEYVPAAYRQLAYADIEIPLGHGEAMMYPRVEARMLQALNIKPTDRILEIGTGSGFVTSLLAHLGDSVYSIEIVPEFSQSAAQKLAAHNITNVTLEVGDGVRGWATHQPYDAILVTGSIPELYKEFKLQLGIGGRLAVVAGSGMVMEALQVVRTGSNDWITTSLFETELKPLVHAVAPRVFEF